ncbi:MAG: HPF/RaiA family ribosome-associated protein [bacterium]
MRVPLELTFRDVRKTSALEAVVHNEAAKLERICPYLTSCSVSIERPHRHEQSGSPYRVRVYVRVPPGHELVARRESGEGDLHENLETVVRRAFRGLERQLREITEKQRGEVKIHEMQETTAVVEQLFTEQGFGFLRTVGGRQIYFHRNSVLYDDFDRLEVGTGVRFVESVGEEGPQASTVKVVDKPGKRAAGGQQEGL